MTDYAAIVRAAVVTANTMTESLQVPVQHAAWTSSDGLGAPVYATRVVRQAIVENKQQQVRTTTGETVLARAKITFLAPITGNGADGRREPFDPRDEIVLPDGTSGPILAINGIADPATNYPYLFEVYLG